MELTSPRAAERLHPFLIDCLIILILLGIFLFMFRDLFFALPDILSGKKLMVADEFVPIYNLQTQFFDLLHWKNTVSPLTNQLEFRIRYSFISVLLRYYRYAPIFLVFVSTFSSYLAYRASFNLVRRVLPQANITHMRIVTVISSLLFMTILLFQKLLDFPLFICAWGPLLFSVYLFLRGVFFSRRWHVWSFVWSSLLMLINPSPHYILIYCFVCVLTTLVCLCGWRINKVFAIQSLLGLFFCLLLTVLPYFLFVKLYVLNGVDWAQQLPINYYSVRDSSVPFFDEISFEATSIVNKVEFGTFMPPYPFIPLVTYFLLLFAPLLGVKTATSDESGRKKTLLWTLYVLLFFSLWGAIGYEVPFWFPSMDRVIQWGMYLLRNSHSLLVDHLFAFVFQMVQILRQPHRFLFITFLVGVFLLPLGILPLLEYMQIRWKRYGAISFVVLFFVPLLSYPMLRQAMFSGNYDGVLQPYPAANLSALRDKLQSLPTGRTVMIPPAGSSKLDYDSEGNAHRFLDRYFIQYLNVQSVYYGLDSDYPNQVPFYLFYRGFYENKNWWINIVRAENIHYIVWNKEMGPSETGVEYLPGLENFGLQKFEQASDFFKKIYENNGFVLFEFMDPPSQAVPPVAYDVNWSSFLCLNESDLHLGENPPVDYSPLDYQKSSQLQMVYSDNPLKTQLDLYAKDHGVQFVLPESQTVPFDQNQVPSSLYLDDTLRALNLLRYSKFNYFNILHPADYDTLNGQYIGLNGPTTLRFHVQNIPVGDYDVYVRSVTTKNTFTIASAKQSLQATVAVTSPRIIYYGSDDKFNKDLHPVDVSSLSTDQLSKLIPDSIIPFAQGFDYAHVGRMHVDPGTILTLEKTDANPMMVEGLLFVPNPADLDTYSSKIRSF